MKAQSKQCEWCSTTFNRKPHHTDQNWDGLRFCSTSCASRWRVAVKEQQNAPNIQTKAEKIINHWLYMFKANYSAQVEWR